MNKIYLGAAAGGLALAVVVGMAKMALDFRRWRDDNDKPRPPWERGQI